MYSPKKVQDATPEHINASLANVAQAINGLSSQRVVDSSSIYIVKNNGYRIQDASSPPIYVFQMTATAQNLLLPDCSRNIGRMIEVDTVLVGSAPSSYGAVTIKAAGNDTIAGVTSVTLSSPWLRCILFSIGTVWILKEYQDSGSNSNGSWVKLADGTMVCRSAGSGLITTSTGSGSVAYATVSFTFPVPFASIHWSGVTPTVTQGGGLTWPGMVSLVTATGCVNYIIGGGTSSQGYLGYVAIGKWK